MKGLRLDGHEHRPAQPQQLLTLTPLPQHPLLQPRPLQDRSAPTAEPQHLLPLPHLPQQPLPQMPRPRH